MIAKQNGEIMIEWIANIISGEEGRKYRLVIDY